jgi:MYXO-CTERM domain-containing protein
VPKGNVTSGTDVAAPDQQNPVPAPEKPIPASAPTWPENPQPLPPPQPSSSSDAGFQWDDAGIGAGGALAIVALAGLGGAFVLRRRHQADPPIAA